MDTWECSASEEVTGGQEKKVDEGVSEASMDTVTAIKTVDMRATMGAIESSIINSVR
jgi:hypothetical protein